MKDEFLKQMQDLLKDEYPAYVQSLSDPPERGFRINTLKNASADAFFKKVSIAHTKSPFASNGFYLKDTINPSSMPEYMAGAFYMQEPSASSAVTILDPKPGMAVLDLCAAPGSKTTQILEKIHHEGIVVANEINHKRAEVLLENVMRNGAANCVVLNDDTHTLSKAFSECFDQVLCDAPCSGEGMMRRDSEAEKQWSLDLVKQCALRQTDILEQAYACLKKGGTLVYSTCTLNTTENEQQILQFLQRHEDMHMIPSGVSFGHEGVITDHDINLARRIYPMDGGEGHFVAKMHKDGYDDTDHFAYLKTTVIPSDIKKMLKEDLDKEYPYLYLYKDRLYAGTHPFIKTDGCHVMRNQVLLGEIRKNRFMYHHHAFMSAYAGFKRHYDMNDEEVKRYMHGEQISADLQKGWYAMCYHGYVIGGGKSDGHALKNHYPKVYRTR